MTGTPTDPDDANHTTLYDPPPPTPPETPAPPPEATGPAGDACSSTGDLGPAAGDLGPAARSHPPRPHRRPPRPPRPRLGRGPCGAPVTTTAGPARSCSASILVAIGLWFFGDQTLGLDMPELSWSQLWPILIIGLGGWIVLGSLRRDA